MASKRTWVVELISQIVKDIPTAKASPMVVAEVIVERLMEEGLLNLGYGDADVDRVVDKFTDTFGTTKVSKNDRFAAHRLTKKYGGQAVCGIVQLLADNNTQKYAPVVGSITQLEEKWVSVMHFLRNIKGEEVINV
jgi:hypothetical protein